jgi:hypothetical protein
MGKMAGASDLRQDFQRDGLLIPSESGMTIPIGQAVVFTVVRLRNSQSSFNLLGPGLKRSLLD